MKLFEQLKTLMYSQIVMKSWLLLLRVSYLLWMRLTSWKWMLC